jgi:hypothetical protein
VASDSNKAHSCEEELMQLLTFLGHPLLVNQVEKVLEIKIEHLR